MAVYRTIKRLDGFEGKKTGKVYTCSRGHVVRAPEGEFDDDVATLKEPDAPASEPTNTKKTKEAK